jgi:hypothetical protein
MKNAFSPNDSNRLCDFASLPLCVESSSASFAPSRFTFRLLSEQRVLDVWTPNVDGTANKRKYTVADTLTGGDVLPGFSVMVGELFPAA